jgi:hypothetical protein
MSGINENETIACYGARDTLLLDPVTKTPYGAQEWFTIMIRRRNGNEYGY